MRLFFSAILLLGTAVALAGCAEQKATDTSAQTASTSTAGVDNQYCPVMGGKVTPDGGTVEWQGKTIGFCCPECIEEFQAMSDSEKAAALAEAGTENAEHDHATHEGHDESDPS